MRKFQILLFAVAIQLACCSSSAGATDPVSLYNEGKYAEAAVAINTSIKQTRSRAQTVRLYYYLGCCYYQLNQSEQAKKVFAHICKYFSTADEAQLAHKMLERIDPATAASLPIAAPQERSNDESGPDEKSVVKADLDKGKSNSSEKFADLPDSAKFNFRRADHGHMVVMPMISGQPVKCWFDTGAGAHFGKNHLRAAGIDFSKAKRSGQTRGWAGNPVDIWTMDVDVSLGNLKRRIPITIEENMTLSPLLGQNLIAGYHYEIDDRAGVVNLRKGSSDKQVQHIDSLYDVPCRKERRHDFVDVTVNGRQYSAFIDTGASSTIMHPDTAESIGIEVPDDAERVVMNGVGGSTTMKVVYLDLRLGPIHKSDFKVLIGGKSGNCIGQDFMEGWRVKIDRERNLLRFFH